jgi:hypothetical protein
MGIASYAPSTALEAGKNVIVEFSIKHRRTYFTKVKSHFGLNGRFMVYGV